MRYPMRTLGGVAALLLFLSGLLGETPAEVNSARGQTLYMPVYSEIPYGDRDLARGLNPAIRILARAAYVRESPALHQAGAEDVFSGEGEVALAMTETILRALGATPEQIDRERERVHRDLVGGSTVAARQDAPHG